MRLNPELIRELLIKIEAAPPNQFITDVAVSPYDRDTVLEHLELLLDNGLIEGKLHSGGIGQGRIGAVIVHRLTMAGHDFLNNSRNDTVWQKTMSTVKAKGGAVSFEVLKVLVVQYAKVHFGLPGA